MCLVEYACTIYIATVYYFQISLFVQLCYIVPTRWTSPPHSGHPALLRSIYSMKNQSALLSFFFNFLVRFTYMYINKIQNSFHIVFFCIYRSSKFTQFTILVNMSKLCNYIIIHTQKHTRLYFYIFKNHLCTYSWSSYGWSGSCSWCSSGPRPGSPVCAV